jgi:tetratricopeptide (TPR) repeat protein
MRLTFLLLVLFISSQAKAHGDLHAKIERVTLLIEKQPENDSLYAVRGKLYYEHEDFDLAIKDFTKALQLNADLANAHEGLALCYLNKKKYKTALKYADKYIEQYPGAAGYELRADILFASGMYTEALTEYRKMQSLVREYSPDRTLKTARCIIKTTSKNKEELLSTLLSDSQKNMGINVSVQSFFIQYYSETGQYRKAILQSDICISAFELPLSWLVRKIELCQKAGFNDTAKSTAVFALKMMDELPEHRRSTKLISGYRAQIKNLTEQ